MTSDFQVVACHGDHAGKAHIAVRSLGCAAEIAIQHIPFETDAAEALAEEQARILLEGARLARLAAEFLEMEARLARGWPTRCPKLGASPTEGEAPNAFGFPISRP